MNTSHEHMPHNKPETVHWDVLGQYAAAVVLSAGAVAAWWAAYEHASEAAVEARAAISIQEAATGNTDANRYVPEAQERIDRAVEEFIPALGYGALGATAIVGSHFLMRQGKKREYRYKFSSNS